MDLLFATTNPGKLAEVRQILEPLGIRVLSLGDLKLDIEEPEETADSFTGNAQLKARVYAAASQLRCLAEDSGLEVDALSGAPGVHSARYAKATGTREERDQANNQRLLRELAEVPEPQRGARFVCWMAVCDPDGSIVCESRGTFEGRIAFEPAGTNGFGYDPLLYLADVGCTAAQLASAQKNARSHRGAAARQLARLLCP